ncbi:Crp/Fnr family transcriptional regulator [Pedobacter sp. BAL39]|uniref:Crp/Fnr family transcriptional regulator n=1 Tax=Pedobacter sp. BAL39 TaxID=391596 RepID=UPI0002E6C224|nr:cyclic nucleotide-binding protein [Pedobacter sp. BAL39]
MYLLEEIITDIMPLSEQSMKRLIAEFQEVKHPRGTHLFRQHEIDKTLYFIKSGVARAYNQSATTDVTFWFGMEGSSALSYNSYMKGTCGYESVELLENSILYEIAHPNLELLYNTDIEIANWGRKLVEKEIIKVEERLISRLLFNAGDRYKELMQHHPELLKRVQLSYIASYLGITPVSLSRIRAGIR